MTTAAKTASHLNANAARRHVLDDIGRLQDRIQKGIAAHLDAHGWRESSDWTGFGDLVQVRADMAELVRFLENRASVEEVRAGFKYNG